MAKGKVRKPNTIDIVWPVSLRCEEDHVDIWCAAVSTTGWNRLTMRKMKSIRDWLTRAIEWMEEK